jgi:hypothetical protein
MLPVAAWHRGAAFSGLVGKLQGSLPGLRKGATGVAISRIRLLLWQKVIRMRAGCGLRAGGRLGC